VGLTFTVGNPVDALTQPYADRVRATLEKHCGDSVVLDSEEAPYFSAELGWDGWRSLQKKAVEAVGASKVPHFLSMEAWCGSYVPTVTQPGSFEFDGEPTKLDIASLPALLDESSH
jgi:hypothetical protein